MIQLIADLEKAIQDSGIADGNTTRVIIDMQAGHFPQIWVQKVGDEKLLNLIEIISNSNPIIRNPSDDS